MRLLRRIRDRTAVRVVKFAALAAVNPRPHSAARCEMWCACRRESEIAQQRALWNLLRLLRRIRDRTAARVVKAGALATCTSSNQTQSDCTVTVSALLTKHGILPCSTEAMDMRFNNASRYSITCNSISQALAITLPYLRKLKVIDKPDPIRLHRYCACLFDKARRLAPFERS